MVTDAKTSDYRELLIFEDKVFRIPFLKIVPKLYSDKEKCALYHGIVRKNGKIVGGVAVYPSQMNTPCGSLKAVGIGSVAVSSKERGLGIMGELMAYAHKKAVETGAEIGVLSGYRKRYERLGYVPGGERYVFEITDYHISHNENIKRYSFVSLEKNESQLENVMKLFKSQKVYWKREKEDFGIISRTWHNRCLVILDEKGAFAGYLIAEPFSKKIAEINICDAEKLSDILVSFALAHRNKSAEVTLFPWQNELLNEISGFGEHMRTESAAMFRFFDFKRPIEVMMNMKLRKENLFEGSLIINIEGEKLKVSVCDKICTVSETDEKEDIYLTYSEAVAALTTKEAFVDNPLFKSWSPICPLSIPHSDMV